MTRHVTTLSIHNLPPTFSVSSPQTWMLFPQSPAMWRAESWHEIKMTHMRPWHLHDKRFTPRHASWRANEQELVDSVHRGAWGCGQCVPGRGKNFKKFTSQHALSPSLLKVHELFTKLIRKYNFVMTAWETRNSAVGEKPRALCIPEYFAKSLKITHGHSKWQCWVDRL